MKHSVLLTAVLSLALLAGCAVPAAGPAAAQPASEPVQKPALLAVSFGTSYNDSREVTIGAIENALKTAYPDYDVRRAFTSQIIIDKLSERDQLEIDNVEQAMQRLAADGVKNVVIQPTHVMQGFEYDDVVKEVTQYKDKFDSFSIGLPLLTDDADYDRMAEIITSATKDSNTDGTAIVFMGHGTEHEANAAYAKLQQKLTDAGFSNYFIGTVEASPSLDDVLALVGQSGAKKVVLRPLMIVAGDHANNDMAGDEEDSWKTAFENAGFEVECVIEGLGQLPEIQQMFVEHASKAMAE